MNKKKVVFNWSSGKDSALALDLMLRDEKYQVVLLLTTLSESYRRVSQHGVREDLLELQSERLGIPLKKVWLPRDLSMERYGAIMEQVLTGLRKEGIGIAAFGDIFLEGLRRYREASLSELDMEALFPVWQSDTTDLANRFINNGFKAKVVCVNARYLGRSFAGREFDRNFLETLPADVDPCGENGEFHTFVYDGPLFSKGIRLRRGSVIYRDPPPPEDEQADDPGFRCGAASGETSERGLWFCEMEAVHVSNNSQ